MQAKFSPLHAAARELAQSGTPVFPCVPGGKKPATANGFHDATTDLAQIDAWWTENPEYNIAFSPADVGLGVVDLDGLAAQNEWMELEIEHGFSPETYTVETPRPDGLHLYFRGELPPTQHKLGAHIDTRGRGSYALVPPSVIDGRGEPDPSRHGQYRVRDGSGAADPSGSAACPTWIVPHLASFKREAAKASTEVELDTPRAVARATKLLKDYVARGHVAVEGEGGNTRTFAVACEVQNLGLSPEMALDLINDIWNPACVPPWDDGELETLVQNAASYAQNEVGAWASGSSQDVFGPVLDKLGATVTEETRRSRFKGMTLDELAALPPPSWLIPELLPDKRVTMIYGQPGSYKSFLTLGYAMELAKAGTRVLYVAGEGARELEVRARSWLLLNGGPEGELPIQIAGDIPWAADGEQLAEFIEVNREFKPDLVILDTVARAMVTLNENDAKDMGTFVAYADTIKRALNVAVIVVHHSGKDDTRGARGSGALMGAVDAAIEVKSDKKTMAAEVWVRRMKDAAERQTPWTFEGRSVGQSLVFVPTTAAEHRMLTHVEDVASPRKVGAALFRLKAVEEDAGVTTRVLAAELLRETGDAEGAEEFEERVGRLERGLKAKAGEGGILEAYCTRKGRERVWHVPG